MSSQLTELVTNKKEKFIFVFCSMFEISLLPIEMQIFTTKENRLDIQDLDDFTHR